MSTTILTIFTLILSHSVIAKKVDLRNKRVPGIRVSYPNTVLLEQVARQNGEGRMDTEKILVKMLCYKKWKVRGRDSTRTYQCDPIEMEIPAPQNP